MTSINTDRHSFMKKCSRAAQGRPIENPRSPGSQGQALME